MKARHAEVPIVNPHPSLGERLRTLSYRDAHKYLRGFGCSKSERAQILRVVGFAEQGGAK
jgi:hypothetical protein